MSALDVRFQNGGVFLPELGLWLDPREPKTGPELVFVSHAHSDHTARHREVITSRPTARLMQARLGGGGQEHELEFNQPTEFTGPAGAFRITLLPAGHIFGSAMAFIEAGGSSLLFTGDFKLRAGRSAEKCAPRPADVLIMETTFGRPVYRFPPADEVLQGVIRFCREALDNEETPVLLGYSLGKSQELLCGLADAGLPLVLHGSVHRLTRIYEQFGQSFPPYEKYESGRVKGRVFICPPSVVHSSLLRNLGAVRVGVLTGWAVDPTCRFRYQAHAAFPLSDHADFPDLVEMVRCVTPRRVYTLHGFAAEFAQSLRDLGFAAEALSEDDQFALPLPPLTGAPLREEPAVVEAAWRSEPLASETTALRPSLGASALTKTEFEPGAEPGSDAADRVDRGRSATSSFNTFALTCLQISSTARKSEKTALLATYLKRLEGPELSSVCTWFTGHPFAPVENKVLQLGWAIVRDALCAVARMDQGQFGQVYLKHSDLGETTLELLLYIAPAGSNLTLLAIQEIFQQLYAARGPSAKLPLLQHALARCTALEGKYLVKILTGDLRIGLKEGLVEESIAQAFTVALEQVRNTNLMLGNIGETAVFAQRGELSAARLVPFRPLKFMLASPEATAAEIWDRVQRWARVEAFSAAGQPPLPLGQVESPPTVWVEDKYDGIRSQIHKVGGRVAIYSRDLREITPSFLDIADAVQSIPADFIVDGEIVAMRGEEVLPFAELQRRLGRREGDLFLGQQIPVRFVAFDLLWYQGETLLDRPLLERRTRLEALTGPALRVSHVTRTHAAAEIDEAFRNARTRGNEGLMIKDPASPYTPGRRGLAWLKLKKALATLDCVVVGAEYGHGKRKAVLSDYTFAVRDEKTGQLLTIGKAYSGLTDAEIAQLTRHFLKGSPPQSSRFIAVEPEVVLEIAFDRVQESSRHPSGLALRFPRIVRIRTDKTLADIDTIETARRLVKRETKPAADGA